MTFRFPVGPSHGRCNICGEQGELTANHVPPQGWAKGIALRVASIADTISGDKHPPSYKMPNGVHFRTLCRRCNGALMSPYDKALISMCNQVAALLTDPGKVNFYHSIRIKPQLVAAREAAAERSAAKLRESFARGVAITDRTSSCPSSSA